MMAFGIVTLRWQMFGIEMQNVLGVQHPDEAMPGGWEIPVYGALASAMESWAGAMADDLSIASFFYKDVTGAAPYSPQAESVFTPLTGADTGTPLPTQVAYTLAFITGDEDVRGGYAALPGCTAAMLTNGLVSTGAKAAILEGWADYVTALGASDMQPWVLRVGYSGMQATVGAFIKTATVRSEFGTLRSRKSGVGI